MCTCIVKTNRSLQRLCFNEKSVTKQYPCLKLLLHESYNLSAYNTMAFPIYFQKNIWSINIVLPSVTASSFNTATPSLCPCSSEGEHSQPTTDYPNTTATAGAGIIMTSKQFWVFTTVSKGVFVLLPPRETFTANNSNRVHSHHGYWSSW